MAKLAYLAAACAIPLSGPALGGPAQAAAPGVDSAIVRINRETGGHCTGFAVNRRTVVTAAHCLWLARPRNWIRPTSLHVLVGYDRGAFRQHLRVKAYRVAADFKPGVGRKSGRGGDWAMLDLAAPFQGRPLPLAKGPPAIGRGLSLAGYSVTRRHRLKRHAACRVERLLGRGAVRFTHSCPAGPGHSGAPMFAWSDGVRVAYGVHTATNGKVGLAFAGYGVRTDRSRRPY